MFIALFIVWLIFNGQVTVELILFGLAFAALIFGFLCKFMDYSIQKDLYYCRKLFWMIRYCFILLWEIIKANLCVIKILFSVKYEKEPVLVSFTSPVKSRTAKVILANSITLTPGTITVKLEGDLFQVHCLDKELAVGLDRSVFVEQLLKFEQMS